MNEYVLESWKEARKKDDVKLITVHNNSKHLRVFIRWCYEGLQDRPHLFKKVAADLGFEDNTVISCLEKVRSLT